MAYHFVNKKLSEVEKIDELDSCAYTVLAAMFSAVEPTLLEKQRQGRSVSANKKGKVLREIWARTRAVPKKDYSSEPCLPVIEVFQGTGKKATEVSERVEKNEKLKYFWLKAITGDQDVFVEACALLMAHLDLANMPGNQCTAVVRHQRTLYVTGNGLWESGAKLEQHEDGALSADTPWFSSADACRRALVALAGSIEKEYQLNRVVFVIPQVGDVEGKFHAEMQLLEYMLDNNILPERGYMGVSKPCCNFCRAQLVSAGLFFWNEHGLRGGNPNDSVEAPYTSYKDPEKLMRFKSAMDQLPFYGLHG